MERLMTTEEVAEFLKVDVVTVRRLINRGDLGGYRVGGEFRFTESDIENYLKMQRVPPATFSEEVLQSGDPLHVAFLELAKRMGARSRDRFDKFTVRARRVMALAQAEAMRLKHNYIGTEHLLLGLLREGDGVAAEVLRNLGVNLEEVRSRVEGIIGWGNKIVDTAVGLTPRAKKVIELAVDEARRMGHHYIGTEHLLLGLLREGEGIGAKVLSDLGVALDSVRTETVSILAAQQEVAAEQLSAASPEPPPEAATLLKEGEESQTCLRCEAQNPAYFRYCFNCGNQLG